jgi:hypothetical protein
MSERKALRDSWGGRWNSGGIEKWRYLLQKDRVEREKKIWSIWKMTKTMIN